MAVFLVGSAELRIEVSGRDNRIRHTLPDLGQAKAAVLASLRSRESQRHSLCLALAGDLRSEYVKALGQGKLSIKRLETEIAGLEIDKADASQAIRNLRRDLSAIILLVVAKPNAGQPVYHGIFK